MNPTTPPPVPVERLRHVQHEALLRRDFDTQAALDDQYRWWHNRAVHNTYGIVEGLDVGFDAQQVTVQPGLAYDDFGRELWLGSAWSAPLPDATDAQALVLVRVAPAGSTCAPPPSGWCRATHASDAAAVVATVQWQPLASFTVHDGVVLATWSVNDGIDLSARIYTRAIARPRLGHGATVPGDTAWAPWFQRIDDTFFFLGLQLRIDTSAAGFTDVPCYFVQLDGTMWNANVPGQYLLPFQHIALPTKDAFTYRLLAPWLYRTGGRSAALLRATAVYGSERRFADAFRGFANLTALAVSWIGIQQHHAATGTPAGRVIGGRRAVH